MSPLETPPAAEAPGEAGPAFFEVPGGASPEEVAALVAVLVGLGSGGEEPVAEPSPWADPARRVRRPVSVGPGGWRASALPR